MPPRKPPEFGPQGQPKAGAVCLAKSGSSGRPVRAKPLALAQEADSMGKGEVKAPETEFFMVLLGLRLGFKHLRSF